MNDLKIFENSEFGTVRTVIVNNEPYFVGKDVADILGYQNGSRDINRHTDEEDRLKVMIFDGNQDKETIIINESGLYSLILSSKMPNAKKFKRWVTSEVLPSIRKTGSYQKPMTALEQIQLTQQAVIEVNEKIDTVSKNLENFKEEMPVLGCDIDILTNAKNKKVVPLLGGKNSEAYRNNSTRGKVYSDIANEIKRQFNIPNHKCLRRNQMEQALKIIENYELPICLKEEIESLNSQMSF